MNGAHLLEEIELPLLVIDASVIVKWFKTENEELLPEAQAIYDAHGETILATVPPLCLFEIGNSLWRHQYFTAEQIEQKLMDLRELEDCISFRTPTGDDHMNTLPGQCKGNTPPNTPSTTGYQSRLVL